jgi:hypothetical protein
MSEAGIGEPWRHDLLLHDALHAGRPGACLLIRKQRKRRGFSGAMASLAILLQDGGDVFGEGYAGRIGILAE